MSIFDFNWCSYLQIIKKNLYCPWFVYCIFTSTLTSSSMSLPCIICMFKNNMFIAEHAKANEEKFKKMKEIYNKLREEHVALIRKVCFFPFKKTQPLDAHHISFIKVKCLKVIIAAGKL